jgi:dihydroflavonol-4-reductase
MTDKVEIIAHDTTVCVTGGTGFIAAHIIAMLLKDGFKVNATVRSVKEESKLKFLKDLDKDSRLKFFAADLTTEGISKGF